MDKLNLQKVDILYIYHYGDQHDDDTIKSLSKYKKIISDGGSNIHTNLIKQLEKNFRIKISAYQDNYQVRNFFGASKKIEISEFPTLSGLFKKYLLYYEILLRCIYPGLSFLIKKSNYKYVITKSDFLPDASTGFFIKIRNPKIQWIASYFLEAPKPWDRKSPYKGKYWWIGLCYWLLQRPCYWMIKQKADYVLVTSEPDVKKFITKKRDESKIIVVQGGVDITESEEYLKSGKIISVEQRKYDACFVGRFHHQKGVLELINIWRLVCNQKKDAKLAMIGVGPLENDIRKKIKENNFENNFDLLGLMLGEDKYEIFKQSKIIVHPATYDSGGMAAAGGMAWGLPGISFDLESLKTYYPKGMIKTGCFDFKEFAENILKLLNDKSFYNELSKQAHDLIVEVWDWNKRAEMLYNKLFNHN